MLTYTVQHGDTLWEIAKENQISLDSLLMANPQISDPNIIMPGMKLHIPQLSPYSRESNTATMSNKAKAATADSETKKSQAAGAQTTKQRPYIYFAKQGESLQNIAKANQLSFGELAKVNQHLPANKALKNNDKVFIPNVSSATVKAEKVKPTGKAMNTNTQNNMQNVLICPHCGYKITMK